MEDNASAAFESKAPPKKHKRGDYIAVSGCPGSFLQYTPTGSGCNVILRGNNTRPKRIPLNEIQVIEKLRFDGEYFMIAGKLWKIYPRLTFSYLD